LIYLSLINASSISSISIEQNDELGETILFLYVIVWSPYNAHILLFDDKWISGDADTKLFIILVGVGEAHYYGLMPEEYSCYSLLMFDDVRLKS
jgi:hypothetical protein